MAGPVKGPARAVLGVGQSVGNQNPIPDSGLGVITRFLEHRDDLDRDHQSAGRRARSRASVNGV